MLGSRRPNADGVVRGDLYLRGGGDPTFGSTSFAERAYGGGGATVEGLAREVKRAGVRRVTGRVYGDESLFDSLRGGPDSGYGTSVWVGPLSALAFNRGLAREEGSSFQRRPPEFAAKRLTAALEQHRRTRGREGGRPRAAGAGAREIASLESIALSRIVRITNNISDNFFAETLAKRLDARSGHPGTTDGGAAAVVGLREPAVRRERAARGRLRPRARQPGGPARRGEAPARHAPARRLPGLLRLARRRGRLRDAPGPPGEQAAAGPRPARSAA